MVMVIWLNSFPGISLENCFAIENQQSKKSTMQQFNNQTTQQFNNSAITYLHNQYSIFAKQI
jgi:hypothetical protein